MRAAPWVLAAALLSPRAAPSPASPMPGGGDGCVRLDRIVTRSAPDDRTLDVRLVGGRRYRSVLPDACPHLSEIDGFYTLRFESFSGERVCAGDRFRVVELRVAGPDAARSFAQCRFGPFRELPRAEAGQPPRAGRSSVRFR